MTEIEHSSPVNPRRGVWYIDCMPVSLKSKYIIVKYHADVVRMGLLTSQCIHIKFRFWNVRVVFINWSCKARHKRSIFFKCNVWCVWHAISGGKKNQSNNMFPVLLEMAANSYQYSRRYTQFGCFMTPDEHCKEIAVERRFICSERVFLWLN